MNRYVALLRGINVGGNNLIKMPALKACFEAQEFQDVATYIQSGNVLFGARETDCTLMCRPIEDALSRSFNYPSRVVIRSYPQMKAIVQRAPKGFGAEPGLYSYDVIFLREPLTAKEAMKQVTLKDGVDQAFAGKGVLYFSRLIAKSSQSRLQRITSLPIYKSMTIRNWNTTTRLLKLMEQAETKQP